MNISNIKRRADEVLYQCKPQLIRVFIIMMLIKLIPALLPANENSFVTLLSLIVSVALVTFDHGYIVSTLKAVRHNSQEINDDDAFVGWRRFKELFFTYFLSALVIAIVTFVLTFILTFIFMIIFVNSSSMLSAVSLLQGDIYSQIPLLMQYAPQFVIVFILMTLIVAVVVFIISIFLFAMPYLLEQHHMTGVAALKESVSLMKDHAWDLFKLMFSFVGWIILTSIIQGVISTLLAFLPVLGELIAIAVSSLFAVYTYSIKYALARAIFFEEIAYYRYEQKKAHNVINNEQEV